ncbi:putative glucosidase SIM1 KNAG_0E01810 [Huiozyma naganishii CBS 8797]|uniref:Uncharacterized protein n=1 Tax=Huiozyma naganishii (strain ATCC MYA-139 / BCRC 22969 / CBS 8797 / KCTC 17520 / NBRC 10181 / NCYC 3082 / Yp74L-3) TaxID=1071383 RepID=J7RLN2_HUIN7|nr:hypothetical protein KNAG_0E01810 [Kazachstania naganishii CBS 8797]CCK70443.1 hypothetical protein KNAG_0E01810 [Kazachstania naganishii CBS 8797]
MKFTSSALTATLIGSGAIAAALPAIEQPAADCTTTVAANNHQHKRAVAVEYVYQTVTVDDSGNTITAPQPTTLTPTAVGATDAGDVHVTAPAPATTEAAATTTLAPGTTATTTTPEAETTQPATTTAAATQPATTTAAAPATTTTASSGSSGSSSSGNGGIYGDLASFSGPSEQFEDGTIPCDSFPSGQGVISVSWLGEGGWAGVEHQDTSTGGSCTEGSYCSYACQPGMSKTQWPTDQPSDGRSVGGLLCKNGMLYRSNTNSNYLCEWGVDAAVVVSELSQSVAICRTDYPGTENMVIPTFVEAGSSLPLTVVDQDSYYTWKGMKTSAQYYVNNAGVSVEDGCVWGTDGSGIGNWAPLNFGAGSTNGITYLSLIPNPNNKSPLNFNVKIVADEGATVNGDCAYENGSYTGGADGCTAAVTNGRAKFVLYN